MLTRNWRVIVSALLSVAVLVIVILKRSEILDALTLLKTAQPVWIALAFGLNLASFFMISQIYRIALYSLGYRNFGALRLYGIATVSLILSQLIPAGVVASYAYLTDEMRRRGVPPGHTTLIVSLETITYVISLLIVFGYSLAYLALRTGTGTGSGDEASLLALIIPVVLVGGALFVLSRPKATLTSWLLGLNRAASRLLRRELSDAPLLKLADELSGGRELIVNRPWMLVALIGVELTGLIGQSIALLLVLRGLGVQLSIQASIAAFGIVPGVGLFNVLPGGGGTVETALTLALQGLGADKIAVPAAVVFRLINFWIMVPIAGICYLLLAREPPIERAERVGG